MAEFLHETLLQFVLLDEADDVAHHRAEGLLLYTHLETGAYSSVLNCGKCAKKPKKTRAFA